MTLKANIEATMFRKEGDLYMHFLHEHFLSITNERHDISFVEKKGLCTGGPVWNTTIDRHRGLKCVYHVSYYIYIRVNSVAC